MVISVYKPVRALNFHGKIISVCLVSRAVPRGQAEKHRASGANRKRRYPVCKRRQSINKRRKTVHSLPQVPNLLCTALVPRFLGSNPKTFEFRNSCTVVYTHNYCVLQFKKLDRINILFLVTEQEEKKKILSEKERKLEDLQKEIENLQKKEKDKDKLDEKISDQNKTLEEHQKRFSELEEKLKKTEGLLAKSKEKASKLEKEVRHTHKNFC